MSWFRLRPTFDLAISDTRQQVIEKLLTAYQRVGADSGFLVHGEYGELHLAAAEHRLWSPHLSFYVSEHHGSTHVRGRFAPRLEVWTFVWVVYMAMAILAFYGCALAYSQWMLNEPSWGLWVSAASVIAILALYLVAHTGQYCSRDQMEQLRSRLETLLEESAIKVIHPDAIEAKVIEPNAVQG